MPICRSWPWWAAAVGAAAVVSLVVLAAPAAGGLSGPQPRASDSSAVPVSAARKAPRLLPDARSLPARDLSIRRNAAGRRTIRFESGLANTGHGVLELRPNNLGDCRRNEQHASQIMFRDRNRNGWYDRDADNRSVRHDAGCMVFHPSHDHWHFEAAARYALWRPDRDRPIVVKGRKMSFCLRDSERVPPKWDIRHYAEYYGACSQDTRQGISIGWVDVYGSYLPGQFLTLPDGLPNGLYCLRTTVDPRDQLLESDDDNNHSVQSVRIRGDRVAAKPLRRCRSVL